MPTFQELLQQANREGYRDGLKAGQARGEAVGILEGIKAGQSNAAALLPAVKAVLLKGIVTSEPQATETVSKSTIIQPPDATTQPTKSGSRFTKSHELLGMGTDIDTTSSPELRNRVLPRLILTDFMRGGNFLERLHSDLASEREDAETQIEEAISQLDTESPHVEPDGDEYEDGEGFVGEQYDHDETTEEIDREQDMLHAAYDEDLDTDEEDSELEDFDDDDDTDDEFFDDDDDMDDDMDDDDSDLFDDEDDDDDYYETEDDDDTYTDEDDQ